MRRSIQWMFCYVKLDIPMNLRDRFGNGEVSGRNFIAVPFEQHL